MNILSMNESQLPQAVAVAVAWARMTGWVCKGGEEGGDEYPLLGSFWLLLIPLWKNAIPAGNMQERRVKVLFEQRLHPEPETQGSMRALQATFL